jgi:transmembrane sensor
MSESKPADARAVALREIAATWAARRDRGLSAAESIEFELWLAADPRHAAALRAIDQAWTLLDRTPEALAQLELAKLARRRARRRNAFVFASLAAAAVLVLSLTLWRTRPHPTEHAAGLVATGPREVTLADGSLVRLNAGSEIVEEFQPAERRVRLTRGEAHFTVEKNPARPFVVQAGALRVSAVGTAFNVNLQSSQVEVLVTEGKVSLATNAAEEVPSPPPLLAAGERAVLTHGRAAPEAVVTRVEPAEIARALAWRDSLVRLGGATLAEVAQDFERRFGARMVIADPELAGLQAGGRLRADDPESFAKLLATTFDLDVERATDGAWVLRKKNPNSR